MEHIYDDIYVLRIKGNQDRTRFIFLREDKGSKVLQGYLRRVELDYDNIVNLRNSLVNGKKSRKKYRISNELVDVFLHCRFPLAFANREVTMDHIVRAMTCGREGIFMLLTNHPLTEPSKPCQFANPGTRFLPRPST